MHLNDDYDLIDCEVVALISLKPTPASHSWTIGLLLGVTLPLAVYLAASLTMLGLNKYYYILAGGKKFATFPNVYSYLSISTTYVALVLLHLVWVVASERSYQFPKFAQVLRVSGVFLLLALIAYPLGNDI